MIFDDILSLVHRLSGQTLIELLIAMAVITTGLFAVATMVFSNLQLETRDMDEVVAVNLAREGIEEAKALRDANWLAGNPFDQGFSGANDDYTAVPAWSGDPTVSAMSFDFSPSTITDPGALVRQSTDLATNGFLTQSDPSAPLTRWRRLLTFHPLCENGQTLTSMDEGQDCGSLPKVGIRVETHIQWSQRGRIVDRYLYEDLFDWR